MGIINFQGEFIPVANVRKFFNLPERDIELNDQLIIANTSLRTVALWVDSVSDVVERDEEEIFKAKKIFLGVDYVEGIFKFDDGIVLLHDLDKFLTLKEITLLKAALKKGGEKRVRSWEDTFFINARSFLKKYVISRPDPIIP